MTMKITPIKNRYLNFSLRNAIENTWFSKGAADAMVIDTDAPFSFTPI